MKIKVGQQRNYKQFIESSDEDYSYSICDFAIKWADLMELHINDGESVADIAETTREKAGFNNLNGFQFGLAVMALSQLWKYGKELQEWYDKKYYYSRRLIIRD